MRRGEVWWGRPALSGGSKKRRPFIVVSADAFNKNERYRKVVVVHLTSVKRAGGPYPWEVDLPQGVAGLPHASVAKCAELYTFLKSDMKSLAGTLPNDYVERLNAALAVALELHQAY